jgi:spermidine/putrescine transport system permease protein
MAGAIISSPQMETPSRTMSRGQLYLLSPAVVLISLFLILPLSLIVIFSFLEPGTYGGVEWTFTTKAYVQFLFEEDFLTGALVFNADYLSIFSNSLLLASTSTVLCLLIGFPTAYFIATRPERTRTIWLFAVTIPYWVNLLIRTVAMLFLLRDQGPINAFLLKLGVISEPLHLAYSNFAIGLGLFYSYLPFMVLPIYASIERMDFSLVEAAHDLYASRWTTLRHIIIPAVKPGIVAGCLLVFIPSLGAFIAPDILGGGKSLMIGNLIALQFQGSRNWPFGAALAVILLTIILIVLMVFGRRSAREAVK